MRIYELIIDETDIDNGIEAISLVESPAIESDFVALSKDAPVRLAKADEEKRMIFGYALIPNKPIYRRNEDDEYYIFFSNKTVERAAHQYLKQGNQANATLEHQDKISGVTVVESWLVTDPNNDKANSFAVDKPKGGEWAVLMKVDDDSLWEEYVKTGKVKGFSIEGYFSEKAKLAKAEEPNYKELAKSLIDEIRK
jgi:hypothetical protein